MNQWEIVLSRGSLKFLRKNRFSETVATEAVITAIKKLSGEEINLDLKKLHPPYAGYFRVRSGRLRIIFNVDFTAHVAGVIEINWRGSAYQS
ncbi:MAG: hypothetical protein V1704_01290 [Candidatus Vogelbacteria bacterium]